MIRRRRPQREIPFSFDSFLDVVANIVGIIIRLILVAWVGAQAYQVVVPLPPVPALPGIEEPSPLPEPTEPRLDQIARRRADVVREKEEAEGRYAGKEQTIHDEADRLRRQFAELASQREALQHQQGELKVEAGEQAKAARGALLSVEQLQKRSDRLLAELKKAQEQPAPTKQLRYHTPVSAVVQTEEVMFECRGGRVTLLDTAALLEQIRRVVRSKGDELRQRWKVRDVTQPVGAFRLRYVIERERTTLDGPAAGAPVDGAYRYGLSGWEAEPILTERGELAEQALAGGSAFRKVVDDLDPQQTVVTFWVYPDSFALYRRLRDYLHAKDVVVAGRPLPEGVPIASSRNGTASRGQ